jgi:multidrug efflux pump subunit AcrA (membrane-fusion protein)
MVTKKPGPNSIGLRAFSIVILLAIAVCGLMYRDALWSRITQVLADSSGDPIPEHAVEMATYTLTVPADGEITGLQSVPVQTPQTRRGGLTLAWIIPEGSLVEEGDPIIRYDSTDEELNLEKQQNLLAANKQRFKITTGDQRTEDDALGLDIEGARLDYQYSMDILPEDETIFSKWDIIEARIDAAFARERIDFLTRKRRVQERIARSDRQILAIERNKAETEAAISRRTLESLDRQAPVSGLVLYRRNRGREPQIGQQYWPGQVLIEVVDLEALQARVYVLERDAGGLTEGREAFVGLDSLPEKRFQGVIESVTPLAQSLEPNSPLRYFTCDVRIRGAREYLKQIRPGMAVKAEIVLAEYDSCFVVPASAVTVKGSESLVYIRQDKTYVSRSVQTAQGSHGQAVILSGLRDGEIVALRNPFESRRLYLPDFSKATVGTDSRPPGGRGGHRH